MIKSEFLGIPELTQNPCTCTIICFLGLGIDTVSKTIFISEDKVTVLLKLCILSSCICSTSWRWNIFPFHKKLKRNKIGFRNVGRISRKVNELTPFLSLTWQDDETLEFYTDRSGSKRCRLYCQSMVLFCLTFKMVLQHNKINYIFGNCVILF